MKLKPGVKTSFGNAGHRRPIKKGDTVKVRLNGWLNQGQQIQENHFCEVVVGSRDVIPGIDYSIDGMRRDGKRRIKISPHLGYREAGVENLIPPNAVLVYEIEVLEVKQAANTRWSEIENQNDLHFKSQLSGSDNRKARTMPTLFFSGRMVEIFCFQAVADRHRSL
jgi:FKBP-type peptidyl-prolyl cis-trans isomerase